MRSPNSPHAAPRHAPLACFCVAAILSAASVASIVQNALDNNLEVGRRTNPTQRATVGMTKPIYSVNQRTGAYTYNRTNAFNDSTYQIYDRYRFGPTNTPPVGSRSATAGTRPTGALANRAATPARPQHPQVSDPSAQARATRSASTQRRTAASASRSGSSNPWLIIPQGYSPVVGTSRPGMPQMTQTYSSGLHRPVYRATDGQTTVNVNVNRNVGPR